MINIEKEEDLNALTYKNGAAPYEKTKFGQLEEFLKDSNVVLEQLKQ